MNVLQALKSYLQGCLRWLQLSNWAYAPAQRTATLNICTPVDAAASPKADNSEARLT